MTGRIFISRVRRRAVGHAAVEKKMRLIQMVMLLTGLFMAAVPVGCTRKDARKDKDAVKKTRTMGIWLAAAAAIWLICSAI